MTMDDMHPVLFSDLLHIDGSLKHIFYTWVAMAILFAVGFILRGRMKLVPTGLQNVMEVLIGGLEEFTVSVCGEQGRKIYHIVGGIFLFIITMNFLGLIPGCDAPTANVNTNAAMALFVFIYYNAIGIRRWGPKYIKHFMGPMLPLAPLMLPIELVSHAARPLSLTLRLFGNIWGEEIVLVLFFAMAPILATLPIYFLFGLAKTMQAFIFFLLTTIYLKGAMDEAH